MKLKKIIALILIFAFFLTPSKTYAYSNPTTITIGTLVDFAALAHTSVSSPTGPTVLNDGDMGVDSSGVCTGFPSPCTASGAGTINNGAIQYQNGVALQGQTMPLLLLPTLPQDQLIQLYLLNLVVKL